MLSIQDLSIEKISFQNREKVQDSLAVEEPLEISLAYWVAGKKQIKPISITMRTPSQDMDLALGFLFTEGIIYSLKQLEEASFENAEESNKICIHLKKNIDVNLSRLERNFYTSSSCGVCGKASIEALQCTHEADLIEGFPVFSRQLICDLPDRMRSTQSIFENTGGIHAAALFDDAGEMLFLREDIGRHNALDKVIGAALVQEKIPLQRYLLQVSGRASFELVQKALMADIPILSAVGAPSSLAVHLAEEAGMTLLGFVKSNRFNCYTHPERII